MSFPEEVVKDAWGGGTGRGEMRGSKASHNHTEGRCNKRLFLEKRGQVGWGAWEACPIDGNPDHVGISNCQILCWDCRIG